MACGYLNRRENLHRVTSADERRGCPTMASSVAPRGGIPGRQCARRNNRSVVIGKKWETAPCKDVYLDGTDTDRKVWIASSLNRAVCPHGQGRSDQM